MSSGTSDEPRLLPEQRVGAALRAARKAAGVGLREMARRLNYGSHSGLSEYEKGAKMPPETVVAGYEHVLGLESGVLTAVLEAANVERHGDTWSNARSVFRCVRSGGAVVCRCHPT
jgi:transcriptional regulator with XRE-family HTH domain